MRLRGLLPCALLVTASLSAADDSPQPLPESLRVTSIQMAIADDWRVNLDRILRGVQEAKAQDARVAVFPETALSGFSRSAVEMLDWTALGAAMQTVADSAKDANIYIIYGSATPSGAAKPHNSALIIGPDGREITRYHKMFPEPWFTPGERLALFKIDGLPCTIMVCHDERFPEIMRIPVLAGARLCFYISYEINSREGAERKREGYRAQLIARAAENNVWVVQSNGTGPLDGADHVSLGESRIVDPGGTVLVQAPALEEAVITGEILPARASRNNAIETFSNPAMKAWWRAGMDLIDRPGGSGQKAQLKDHIRVALLRGVPPKWDLEANFAVFLEQLEKASREDAEFFITPECWLDGYAAADKASTVDRLREIAQDPDSSPYLARVAEEARRRRMFICFGFTSLEDGQIYNAAGLWDDGGNRLGIYHKTHLQTHDLQYCPGDALPVWPTPWGAIGIMICADRRWPETARTLRLKGARLILNPSYGMHGENNEHWMRTRAYENQCFIAFTHPQLGLVTDPKGRTAAKESGDAPALLISDLNLAEARDDNHLRDRRPDIYSTLLTPATR